MRYNNISDDGRVNFEIVGPTEHSEEENDNSLVMYLNYYDKKYFVNW